MKTETMMKRTPWDSAVFGLDTYELETASEETLQQAGRVPGHYTAKVNPLDCKELLHRYGFYYCDTLIEPFCSRDRFVSYSHETVTVSRDVPLDALMDVCHGAFSHGRFHRDFQLDRDAADLRYDNWTKQLHRDGQVYGLWFEGDLAGFIGVSGNKLVLHAVSEKYKGQGLAKYLWSAACHDLFNLGHTELMSSVSASNVAVVNLYVSLGFRFRNAIDIYHRLVL